MPLENDKMRILSELNDLKNKASIIGIRPQIYRKKEDIENEIAILELRQKELSNMYKYTFLENLTIKT